MEARRRNVRSWAALALAILCVVAVLVGALRSVGRAGTEATINDGGAWLLNRDAGAVGHLNREVLEVTAAIRIATPNGDFDVDQASGVTLVHLRTENRLIVLDERTYSPRADVALHATTNVVPVDNGVVLYETEPLRVWSVSAEELLDTTGLDSLPTVYSAESSGAVGVAPSGAIVVAAARPDDLFELFSIVGNQVDGSTTRLPGTHIDQIVPVNDGALVRVDGAAVLVSGATTRTVADDVAMLQQAPLGSASAAAMIGESGDVRIINLAADESATVGQLAGDSYLPPIYHRGCVFAVSLAPREFVKFCNGEESERSPLTGSVSEVRLRLVNGWVWVNDLQTGAAWVASPDADLARIDDWGSALAEDEVDDAEATVNDSGKDPEKKEAPDADDPLFDSVDQIDEDDENEPPVAVDDVAATRSERTVLVPVLANDTDTDGDVLSIAALDLPARTPATVTVPPGSGAIQVRPDAGFTGSMSFSYTVNDGRGGEATGVVSLTVLSADGAANEPPVPQTDVAVARAGSPVSLNVIDNDSDPEGDTLVLTAVEVDSGQMTFDPNGSVTFTPDPTGDDGIVEMAYAVEDDFGAAAQGRIRVRVRIADSNNEPDARNDLIITNVGEAAQVNVLLNDTDPDDDPIYVARQPIAKGLPAGVVVDELVGLALTTDGALSFTPPAPGTYRFEYLVSDGQNSDRAQIRVEAQEASADQPPVAVRDDVAIPIGGTRIVYVLDNDSDPNGDVVGVVEWDEAPGLQIVELPGIGFAVTVEVGAPNRVPFRYAISDGHNEPVSTQVMVAVADVPATNQPPQLTPDTFEVRAGRTSRLSVLANDSDPEGGALRILHVPPLAGEDTSFAIGELGQTVEVTVPADQTRGFTFSYDVEDEAGTTSATSVDVRIIGADEPNRSPVARADVGRTTQSEAAVIAVLANDTDPDSDLLQVESVAQQPLFGSAELGDDGTIVYQPNDGFTGTDRFSYVVVDTEGGRSIGNVSVGVMPKPTTNRAPKAYPETFDVAAGNGSIALDVLANDLDPDGDQLSITSVGIANVGEIETDGATVTYQPPPVGEVSDDGIELSIYYEISDGAGHRDSAVITINVAAKPEPIPPIATDDIAGPVRARTTVLVPVLHNDYDPDGAGQPLGLSSTDPSVRVVGDSLEITSGLESGQYAYTVTDVDGLTDSASVTLFVVDNQAPVVRRMTAETPFGSPISLDLSPLASDADSDDLYFVCCDGVQGGSVSIDASSSNVLRVTFTPNTGFSGQASFSYGVDDQQGHLVSGFASVTVLPPSNRPPVVASGSIDVEAGSGASFDLATLVDDPDPGDSATYRLDTGSAAVPVSLGGSVLTVSAPTGSTGASSDVSFVVTDGAGAQATGSVRVTVIASTKPLPSAIADVAQTNQGLALDINLVGNDIDPVGQGLTIIQVGASPAGTAVEVAPGVVRFSPTPDFFGTATFTYTVGDATGDPSRQAVGQVTVTIVGRPAALIAPSATADNATATVTWTSPPANGSPIDSYRLAINNQTKGSTSIVDLGVQNSYQATGLTNGDVYSFRLQAHNAAGWGDYGDASATVRPDTIPGRPAAPSVSFANGRLDVTWTPPINDGSPLTQYKLEIGGGTSAVISVGAGTTAYGWTGLTNGVEYQFRVVATNSAGDSDASGWSASEHPLGAPAKPSTPTVQRGNQYLDLGWTPPSNNGDAISSFELEVETGGQIVVVSGGSTTSYRWAQLTNGVTYRFRLRASNRAASPGAWSDWSAAVKPCSVPNAPGTPSATRADQSAQVSWSAPGDQGCAISAYNVRVNGGAVQSVGAGVTSHPFTGLTNGTSYQFEVQAVNEEGAGAWSLPSAAVVPAGQPTAPTISSISPTAVGAISVGWGGASANGDAISSYQYRVNGGTASTTTSNPQVVSGLNNSSSYAVEVRACNSIGCGSWSASQSATTWGPPSAPASISASAGNATASLFWAAPANTGGQPVTSWQVLTSPGSLTPSSSSGLSNTYTGLTNGVTYTFQVRACNSVGCGPYGTTSATPTAPPPFVTVGVGSQYTGAGCNSGDCQRISVSGGNFTPNTTITVVCHASNGTAFSSYSTTVNGAGAISSAGCFFGYPGETVWVVAGGVTSPSIVWP